MLFEFKKGKGSILPPVIMKGNFYTMELFMKMKDYRNDELHVCTKHSQVKHAILSLLMLKIFYAPNSIVSAFEFYKKVLLHHIK